MEKEKKIHGRVKAVNISKTKGVVKNPVKEGYFKIDHGLEGDAHAGNWHRQVSLLASESADKVRAAGLDIEDGKFAENITTEGLELYSLPVGTKLKIGESLQEVTQIGKECHTGCAIKQAVGECVMPKEGIFTKVIVSGVVKAGDSIEVV
ncbi:MOSC domain-containing protein [Ilyobacter polytropus]|uniref:MOSC domain containing protein n=1 Tax=Ilyobacter polytropus (strain ATCC 51220 / DSM 2926 / LMG 16218 / CuHBu1) TaxID=572544 RepID=E3H9H1_ILYPC|nr:MOSC domain-containing protein [Ilyobacter polytropus]ADO83080.1 MOSC domain containing protein [Ilyobacter polytropus DSM 2926]